MLGVTYVLPSCVTHDLYCCDLAPHVETFLHWRTSIEVSDLQHDGNHEDRCNEIWICATETGRGDQEACGTEGTKKKKVRSVQNICCSLFRALSCLNELKLF